MARPSSELARLPPWKSNRFFHFADRLPQNYSPRFSINLFIGYVFSLIHIEKGEGEKVKRWIALFLLALSIYWLFTKADMKGVPSSDVEVTTSAKETLLEIDKENESIEINELNSVKGFTDEKVNSVYGAPAYKTPSEYGYDWWIYNQDPSSYKQIGMENGRVVTAVFSEPRAQVEGVTLGASYKELNRLHDFKKTYYVKSEGGYRFELTDQDLIERPLLPIDDQWSMQLYFDTFTNSLSAVRVVRNDILLLMQPYKIVYRGELPNVRPLTRKSWQTVEAGREKQILDLTNHLRTIHGLHSLTLHKEASTVAFLHSRDMDENNYFSHYAQNGDGLKERLEGIYYKQAGENIAAQYIDATAAVHGWLNSEGHREALLEPRYTHIGIGVHERYYTQNFLTLVD